MVCRCRRSRIVASSVSGASSVMPPAISPARSGVRSVGLEPSCTLALRDKIPALLGSAQADTVAESVLTLADGTSCRCQIGDGTDRAAAHLALYLALYINRLGSGSAGARCVRAHPKDAASRRSIENKQN